MKRRLHAHLCRLPAVRHAAVQPLESRVLFAAGDLDTTFGGGDGKVTTDFPGVLNLPFAAALHQGKVLVAGTTAATIGLGGGDFLLARVNPSDGSLDKTFGGGDGFVTTDFGGAAEEAHGLAVLPDGKILVVGTGGSAPFGDHEAVLLARYNPDGSLDTSFGGGDGRVVFRGPGDDGDAGRALLVLPGGKILVVGSTIGPKDTDRSDFLLARFNADGSPDRTFGGGTARVAVDITGDTGPSGFEGSDGASSVAALPDGDFLVGGTTSLSSPIMVRFNPDGTIDPNFRATPNTEPPFARTPRPGVVYTYGSGALLVSGGKILIGGLGSFSLQNNQLARYNLDGTFDTTFGNGGLMQLEVPSRYGGTASVTPRDIDVLPDGDYLVTGTEDEGGTGVVRVSPAGVQRDGAQVCQVGASAAGVPLPDGSVVTVGRNNVNFNAGEQDSEYDINLTRLDRNLDLDLTFGGSDPFGFPGVAVLDFGDREVANAAALGQNGKIVVAGTAQGRVAAVVARYDAGGALDSTFGRGGRAETSLLETGEAAAVLPDGSVLVAGKVRGDFGVVHFFASGDVDTGFGDRGLRKINFASADDSALAIAVAADGKIVLAGRGSNNFGFVRLLPGGAFDASFDGDGRRTIDFGGADEAANAVAVLPDGRIVAGGTSNGNFAVVRLRPDGKPDPTFSGDGKLTLDLGGADAATGLALLTGRKILVTGSGGPGKDFAAARFGDNGAPDNAFSGDGKLTTDFGAADSGEALVTLPNGRFAIVGTTTRGVNDPAAGIFADRDFAVAAYEGDGTPLAGFGTNGKVTTGFFGRSSDTANAAFADAAGRIVAAGESDGDFAVARYLTAQTQPPPPPPPPDQIVLQAEDAKVSGAVVARTWPGYEGTGYVDYVNNTGDSVEWTFDLPAAGNYALVFRYANGGATERPMRMEVNGLVTQFGQGFAPTGSWKTWSTFDTSMFFNPTALPAGRNVVRLIASGVSGPNVDELIVRPFGQTQPPPPPQTLQAEQAELQGPVVRSDQPGFTGSGYADYLGPSGESVRFAVNVDETRRYVLEFRYANGSSASRPLALKWNDATLVDRVQFRPTGSWATWATETVVFTLQPGVTFFTLTSEGASGPNLDSLTVRAL